MNSIETYIGALSKAVKDLEIVTDAAVCSSYITKNYSRTAVSAPKAILYPTTADQVGKIVELANEYKTALVVRSSQGTETYNGVSAPAEGVEAVAVNLSKMNKIMHIDAKNGTALIEAGVTYAQLNEALKEYGCYVEHPLMPRAEKSVIASLLDRDPVMTPKHCWDVPDPLCCVELYMGNGAISRTGSAAGPGTLEEMLASGCAINQPQGPYCLDLVRVMSGAQGTLAIATWASVKIRPIGSICEVIYTQTDDIDALAAYQNQVVRRRLGENTFIVNAAALKQITGMNADTKKWIMVTDVRGNRYFPEQYVGGVIEDMTTLAAEAGLTLEKEIAGVCNQGMKEIIAKIADANDYWKDRKGENRLDLFFQSTLDRVSLYNKLAEAAVAKCGIDVSELAVYVQPLMMGRSCHVEFLVPADAGILDELEPLMGTAMLDNKAFFSRPYGAMVEPVYAKSESQTPFMAYVKGFFDENNILNPGRLVYDGGRK